MNLILEPDMERWPGEEARRSGIAPETFPIEWLRRQKEVSPLNTLASYSETELISRINDGFPAEFWQRYRELVAKRDTGTLLPSEQAELIVHSDSVEQKNAERLPYLRRGAFVLSAKASMVGALRVG